MRAELDDATVVDDRDPVGTHGGGQSMRDQDRSATFEQHIEPVLDLGFGPQVEVGGRLVEDEHTWAGEKRASECEELSLARRERRSPFVHQTCRGREAVGR